MLSIKWQQAVNSRACVLPQITAAPGYVEPHTDGGECGGFGCPTYRYLNAVLGTVLAGFATRGLGGREEGLVVLSRGSEEAFWRALVLMCFSPPFHGTQLPSLIAL